MTRPRFRQSCFPAGSFVLLCAVMEETPSRPVSQP